MVARRSGARLTQQRDRQRDELGAALRRHAGRGGAAAQLVEEPVEAGVAGRRYEQPQPTAWALLTYLPSPLPQHIPTWPNGLTPGTAATPSPATASLETRSALSPACSSTSCPRRRRSPAADGAAHEPVPTRPDQAMTGNRTNRHQREE